MPHKDNYLFRCWRCVDERVCACIPSQVKRSTMTLICQYESSPQGKTYATRQNNRVCMLKFNNRFTLAENVAAPKRHEYPKRPPGTYLPGVQPLLPFILPSMTTKLFPFTSAFPTRVVALSVDPCSDRGLNSSEACTRFYCCFKIYEKET